MAVAVSGSLCATHSPLRNPASGDGVAVGAGGVSVGRRVGVARAVNVGAANGGGTEAELAEAGLADGNGVRVAGIGVDGDAPDGGGGVAGPASLADMRA